MTPTRLKTKKEAVNFLKVLVTEDWFKEERQPLKIVTELLENPNTSAMRLRSCANYWKDKEEIRKSLGIN